MYAQIEALKSTIFFGRRFTRRQISDIAETVAMLPNDNRNELSKTICEHLSWTTPKGEYRAAVCLLLLERLVEFGILTMPAPRGTAAKLPPRPIVHVGYARKLVTAAFSRRSPAIAAPEFETT